MGIIFCSCKTCTDKEDVKNIDRNLVPIVATPPNVPVANADDINFNDIFSGVTNDNEGQPDNIVSVTGMGMDMDNNNDVDDVIPTTELNEAYTLQSVDKNITTARVDEFKYLNNMDDILRNISANYNVNPVGGNINTLPLYENEEDFTTDADEPDSSYSADEFKEILKLKTANKTSLSVKRRDSNLLKNTTELWDIQDINELSKEMQQQIAVLHQMSPKVQMQMQMQNQNNNNNNNNNIIDKTDKGKGMNLYRKRSGLQWDKDDVEKQKKEMAKHMVHLVSTQIKRNSKEKLIHLPSKTDNL